MALLIIGIDPGASGGIAHSIKGIAKAVAMPKNVFAVNEYVKYLTETYGKPIVFVEKVNAYLHGDDAPGKKFGINKMLHNYSELLTVFKLTGIQFVQVHPSTWQKCVPGKVKGESKQDRKTRFKEFAAEKFPETKPTLKTADALCILNFGIDIIQNDVDWVIEKVENAEHKHSNMFLL